MPGILWVFGQLMGMIKSTGQRQCSNSSDISFAAKLWQVFRAVITRALNELRAILEDAVTLVMETIDAHRQRWFVQVLQLDPRTLRL